MSADAYAARLEEEKRRISEQVHALMVRGAHVDSALLLKRQGEDDRVVRAKLESKNIILLCNPPAHAERQP